MLAKTNARESTSEKRGSCCSAAQTRSFAGLEAPACDRGHTRATPTPQHFGAQIKLIISLSAAALPNSRQILHGKPSKSRHRLCRPGPAQGAARLAVPSILLHSTNSNPDPHTFKVCFFKNFRLLLFWPKNSSRALVFHRLASTLRFGLPAMYIHCALFHCSSLFFACISLFWLYIYISVFTFRVFAI